VATSSRKGSRSAKGPPAGGGVGAQASKSAGKQKQACDLVLIKRTPHCTCFTSGRAILFLRIRSRANGKFFFKIVDFFSVALNQRALSS
jgi:hypothetical protein